MDPRLPFLAVLRLLQYIGDKCREHGESAPNRTTKPKPKPKRQVAPNARTDGSKRGNVPSEKTQQGPKAHRSMEVAAWVCTVVLESSASDFRSNQSRMDTMRELLPCLVDSGQSEDVVILFPGGWLSAPKDATDVIRRAEACVRDGLAGTADRTVVCLGVDGRNGRDQLGVAIGRDGVKAIARRFYPHEDDRELVEFAESHTALERGFRRTFTLGDKTFYLSVCYDVYGIRKKELPKPRGGVDAILEMIHRFGPEQGGDRYYASNGLAWGSKWWNCPAFGSAVFYQRRVQVCACDLGVPGLHAMDGRPIADFLTTAACS